MSLSAQSVRAQKAPLRKAGVSFRPDIQGLRAIAVLAVVADHLVSYPAGGFTGVDVFFVISGFLITGQLLRQHETTGRISFSHFYRARIRRILPASLVALIVTVAVSFLVFRPGRALTTLVDGISALFFAGNWRFAAAGTDYWAADGPVSPLQHFWSLGVEEQFYFIWPLVIVGVLALVKGKGAAARIGLFVAMVAIVVLSFAWALYETATNPTWSYFSTFSRAWELGIGAILAIAAPLLVKMDDRVRPTMAWAGVAGIAASICFITSTMPFPGPWAALPVVSTALVIAAGTATKVSRNGLLCNPVMGFVGNISYSLYLWHFPFIIFMQEYVKGWHWSSYLLVFGLVLLVSVLSYHFIEEPIRRSKWLLGKSKPRYKDHRQRYEEPVFGESAQKASLVSLSIATIGMVAFTLVGPHPAAPDSVSVATSQPSAGATPAAAIDPASEVGKLQLQITKAFSVTQWPDLQPSLDNVATDGAPTENSDGCGRVVVNDPKSCSYNPNGSKLAVVYGDSTGITLLRTVKSALGTDYRVRGLTMAACIVLPVAMKEDRQDVRDQCEAHKQASVDYINTQKPAYVFVTTTSGRMSALASGVSESNSGTEWGKASTELLQSLAPSGAKVIFVAAPPQGKAFAECATKTSVPADCAYSVPQGYWIAAGAEKDAASKSPNGAYMDTMLWFCTQSGQCPSFAGTTPLKLDWIHTTRQYADQIVPAFREAMLTLTK